jgi:hypothetical protein
VQRDQLKAIDVETGLTVPLFNPRQDVWDEHFTWQGLELVGQTPVGRATIALLDLNHPRRVFIRRIERGIGEFPPQISK